MLSNEHIAERLAEHERVEMLAIEAQDLKIAKVGSRVEDVYELLTKDVLEAIRRIERRLGIVETKTALARAKGTNGERPPSSHDWGRRDSDYEVTSSGEHVRIEHTTFAQMQRSLAEIEEERRINAAVVKKLKGMWKLAVMVGGPIAAVLGALLHWLAGGGLHHLLGP